jgi:uncharacterized protein with ATP-grasp and redox domains
MKTYLECIPCIIRQCLNTLNLVHCSESISTKAMRELLNNLSKIDYDLPPAYNSDIAYSVSRELAGVKDPYYKLKKECNKLALQIYPRLKEIVKLAPDGLYAGVKIAVEGNIIDLGISKNKENSMDVEKIIDDIKNMPLGVDDYGKFRESLDKAANILYIGDNAGELVFDKVFVEELLKLGKNIVFSVKSGPIINDATMEDAEEVGLCSLVKVIETGNNKIGVNFSHASKEFLEEFRKADLIISKGQGNFETLDDIDANTFFILKAKCSIVASELGVNYLDVVIIKRKPEWGDNKV